ncbi:MAG: hypothetical protein AAB710_00885, partial [Patescibacteria group bacterium]
MCFDGATAAEAEANCAAGCGGAVNCTPAVAGSCSSAVSPGGIAKAGGQILFDIASWTITKTITIILQFINAVLVWLVGYFAQLFDLAIAIALAGFSDLRFIEVGWKIVRDVANLFFIFALLIIAIATILRLESYGWKQLLAKLIVVALLINFSMVIANVVIDASNLLALQFIEPIYPVSDKIATIMGFSKITAHDPTSVPGDPEMPLSEALSNGWNNVLSTFSFSPMQDPNAVQALAFGVGTNKIDTDVAQMVFHMLIFIMLLSAIFIFAALSALVLIRSVTLMILLIFAPFGFFAYILPVTRSISNMWWNKLFYQSFFFPAAAFMLYLSIFYGMEVANMKLPGSQTFNIALLFNYFVILALLIGSLLVARNMGAYGAAAAIGMGNKLKGKLQGYAGRVSRAGLGAIGRPIQQGAGAASGAFLESKAAQRIAQMPVFKQALRVPAAIAQRREQTAKDEAKRITNLSAKQQATMIHTLRADTQAQAFDAMNEKRQGEVVQAMKPEDQIKFYDRI